MFYLYSCLITFILMSFYSAGEWQFIYFALIIDIEKCLYSKSMVSALVALIIMFFSGRLYVDTLLHVMHRNAALHAKGFMFVGSRRTTRTHAHVRWTSNTFISLSPALVCVLFHYLLMGFFIAPLIVITLDLCSCLPGFSAPVYWGHSPDSLSIGLLSEPEHPRPLNPSKTQNSGPNGMRNTSKNKHESQRD